MSRDPWHVRARSRRRLAVALLANGWTPAQVAQFLRCSSQRVREYRRDAAPQTLRPGWTK